MQEHRADEHVSLVEQLRVLQAPSEDVRRRSAVVLAHVVALHREQDGVLVEYLRLVAEGDESLGRARRVVMQAHMLMQEETTLLREWRRLLHAQWFLWDERHALITQSAPTSMQE